MLQKLLAFQKDIFETNQSKGFWPENRNKGEAVMLIITELSEAVEADRKHKRVNTMEPMRFDAFRDIISGKINNLNSTIDTSEITIMQFFQDSVKDTVEDEIADAVIRLLDTTYGFQWPVLERDYRKETMGNFAHDVLRLTWYILLAFEEKTDAHPGKDWGYAMAAIIKFCEWYDINIVQHVEWKLRYNKSRPHKHGGKKY